MITKITEELQAKHRFQFNYVGWWGWVDGDRVVIVERKLSRLLELVNPIVNKGAA